MRPAVLPEPLGGNGRDSWLRICDRALLMRARLSAIQRHGLCFRSVVHFRLRLLFAASIRVIPDQLGGRLQLASAQSQLSTQTCRGSFQPQADPKGARCWPGRACGPIRCWQPQARRQLQSDRRFEGRRVLAGRARRRGAPERGARRVSSLCHTDVAHGRFGVALARDLAALFGV